MTPLERITARINQHGNIQDPDTVRPLLTLAEFFDGNDVTGSIGCNIVPPPTPAEFRAELEIIRARRDVADVRVQVTQFDDPDWPFSDTVWIITSASPEQVATWFRPPFTPDDCFPGWPEPGACERCVVPPGMQPIACWWD